MSKKETPADKDMQQTTKGFEKSTGMKVVQQENPKPGHTDFAYKGDNNKK